MNLKRTEIYFEKGKDNNDKDYIRIVRIKNALDSVASEKVLGKARYKEYLQEGVSYLGGCTTPDIIYLDVVNKKGKNQAIDIEKGDIMSLQRWENIQKLLKLAGERFTVLHQEAVNKVFKV